MTNRERGGAILETALWIPVLLLLLMGTLELGRFGYTYFALQKILYSCARYVSTQQGVNFCDNADPVVTAAKNFALTGTSDGSGVGLINDLTPDMLSIRIESVDSSGAISECACSVPGCDTANGGTPPNYIVVSIPGGYPVTPRIPLIPTTPIPLVPQVRVPYGGT